RIGDSHPRARLEAMRALARLPNARSAELVLSALEKRMDPFLDYAAWLSINDLAEPWIRAVKAGNWQSNEKELEFALRAIEPTNASVAIGEVLRAKEIPRDGSGPWIELIGSAGDEHLLRRLFEQVLNGGFDDAAAARALTALDTAARERSVKP